MGPGPVPAAAGGALGPAAAPAERPDAHPNRIVPELQHLVAGQIVPDAARNYAYWIAARVQPPTTLVYTTTRHLFSQRSVGPGDALPKAWYQASWAFVLEAPDPDTTRLLVRWRMTCVPRRAGLLLMWLLLGPVDLLMQRKLPEASSAWSSDTGARCRLPRLPPPRRCRPSGKENIEEWRR